MNSGQLLVDAVSQAAQQMIFPAAVISGVVFVVGMAMLAHELYRQIGQGRTRR